MRIKFYDIDWDDDGSGDLPDKVVFELDDDFDVESDGADLLSDTYGFCVNGFLFKETD